MATAEKTNVEKVVKTEVKGVTLTLDDAELAVLNTILNRIGGDPTTTRRKHADSIALALEDAGVRIPYSNSGEKGDVDEERRSIYFI